MVELTKREIRMISEETVIKLEAAEYFKLEKATRQLSESGWKMKCFPTFQRGRKTWQVSLFKEVFTG